MYGMKYATMSRKPPAAVMSNGTVRFMPTQLGQDGVGEEVDHRLEERRTGYRRKRGAKDAENDSGGDQQLADVLPLQAPQLIGLARQVRRCREELFANECVIARGHKERELRRLRGAGN